jgi:hypothetical protein
MSVRNKPARKKKFIVILTTMRQDMQHRMH